jgi:hypothetical protein
VFCTLGEDLFEASLRLSAEAHPNKIESAKSKVIWTLINYGFEISFGQFIEA